MQRKRYSAEFKREAVKLASQAGMSKRQLAPGQARRKSSLCNED